VVAVTSLKLDVTESAVIAIPASDGDVDTIRVHVPVDVASESSVQTIIDEENRIATMTMAIIALMLAFMTMPPRS